MYVQYAMELRIVMLKHRKEKIDSWASCSHAATPAWRSGQTWLIGWLTRSYPNWPNDPVGQSFAGFPIPTVGEADEHTAIGSLPLQNS